MSQAHTCSYEIDYAAETVTGYYRDGRRAWRFTLAEIQGCGYATLNEYESFLIRLCYVPRGVPVEDKAVAPQATTKTIEDYIREAMSRPKAKPAADPNAKMIERDGPAKPVIFGIDWAAGCAPAPAPVVSTAHPPIAGLTRTAAIGSHLLGAKSY